jgi:hypothetical protein
MGQVLEAHDDLLRSIDDLNLPSRRPLVCRLADDFGPPQG